MLFPTSDPELRSTFSNATTKTNTIEEKNVKLENLKGCKGKRKKKKKAMRERNQLGKSTSDGNRGRNDPGDINPGKTLRNDFSNLHRGNGT